MARPNDSGIHKVSTFLGFFRWAFMPLGLLALVCVGVHAAADTVDDRLLLLVERLDAFFDTFLGQYESTHAFVDKLGGAERTLIARSLALAWELFVDFCVAMPLLGYREQDERARLFSRTNWKTLLQRLNQKPTPMRLLRPLVTAVFCLAGGYAISQMVETTLYLSLHAGVLPDKFASPLARTVSFAAFGLVAVAFGGRAVLRSLEHADARCEEAVKENHSPYRPGLFGTVFAVPLAIAALIDALPILAFFR